jgi:hypothetical protein
MAESGKPRFGMAKESNIALASIKALVSAVEHMIE